jgi:hypothetical protein
MNNHLISDLTNIVVSYSDTETYKKLKNTFPNEFRDAKIDEMNLLCNIPYKSILKYAEEYKFIQTYTKLEFPNNKVNPEDLIISSTRDYYGHRIPSKILDCKNIYDTRDFLDSLYNFYSKADKNYLLRQRFNVFFISDYEEDERLSKIMMEVRDKILKDEPDIYETTNPWDYIGTIEKYLEIKLTELGY